MIKKCFEFPMKNFLFPILIILTLAELFIFMLLLVLLTFEAISKSAFLLFIILIMFPSMIRYFYKKAPYLYPTTALGTRDYSRELSWKQTF